MGTAASPLGEPIGWVARAPYGVREELNSSRATDFSAEGERVADEDCVLLPMTPPNGIMNGITVWWCTLLDLDT